MTVPVLPTISASLEEDIMSGRRIAIAWGISGSAPLQLKQSPFPISLIVDSSVSDEETSFFGLPVRSPRILADYPSHRVCVICFADLKFADEISQNLKKWGHENLYTPGLPSRLQHHANTAENAEKQAQVDAFNLNQLQPHLNPINQGHKHQVACLVTNTLEYGGAERQLILLALGLERQGWQVHIVCLRHYDKSQQHWLSILKGKHIQIHQVKSQRALWHHNASDWDLALAENVLPFFQIWGVHYLISLCQIISRVQPQFLVGYLDDPNIISGIAGHICQVEKVIMSGRSIAPHNFEIKQHTQKFVLPLVEMKGVYQQLIALPNTSLTANSSAGCLSYSTWLNLPTSDIPVIPNGVSMNIQGSTFNIRELYDLNNYDILILGVMRLSEEKDPKTFVNTIELLNKKNPNIKGILLGDGELALPLRQMVQQKNISQSLILAGNVENTRCYYEQAQLLLATSKIEGLPNVVLEAQLCGCAVVATNVGGTEEALAPQLRNWLVAPENVEQMAANIQYILGLETSKKAFLCQSIKEHVKTHFSVDALALKTLAVFDL